MQPSTIWREMMEMGPGSAVLYGRRARDNDITWNKKGSDGV